MAILCDANTKLLVQGMGRMGRFHAGLSIEYGTQVVGGVAPGKGGQVLDDIPVFDTVRQAVAETGANASVIFVPPSGAADAIVEAADLNAKYELVGGDGGALGAGSYAQAGQSIPIAKCARI